MELNELFYQTYWWFLISLLGALLVFLLFVQGGQSLLAVMGRTETEKSMMVNSLGRKWEFTFTTLVVLFDRFGGNFRCRALLLCGEQHARYDFYRYGYARCRR